MTPFIDGRQGSILLSVFGSPPRTSSKGTNMKIGIVGAGNIGSALTRLLRAAGHEVTIANSRGPESLADLSAETGARAAAIEDAVRGQEVVVVAVPMKNPEPAPRRGLAAVNPGFQVDLVISDIVRDMEDWIELPIRVASCMAA